MRVGVTKTICASHRLWRPDWSQEKNREIFGKCESQHGHNWEITIEVEGDVSLETGMVVNFSELSALIMLWDHEDLNAFVELPTAENLVLILVEKVRALGSFDEIYVGVKETDHTIAEETWTAD